MSIDRHATTIREPAWLIMVFVSSDLLVRRSIIERRHGCERLAGLLVNPEAKYAARRGGRAIDLLQTERSPSVIRHSPVLITLVGWRVSRRSMTEVLTSCGVLVVASTAEILLGHATGGRHWDIFKGLLEPGETARDTALRKLREECGLMPQPADLKDQGRFDCLPRKNLHLCAMTIDRIATSSFNCTSTFVDRFGRRRLEMDGFEWVPFHQVAQRCGKGLTRVLTSPILTGALEKCRRHNLLA